MKDSREPSEDRKSSFRTASKRFLIVKTSSLGDIIHAFPVLQFLSLRFPEAEIDWAVEERISPVVAAHPLVSKVLVFSFQEWKRGWKKEAAVWKKLKRQFSSLRQARYDAVFDLQGNGKSALVTAFAKAKAKVGLGRRSVREWPNLLATRFRFEVAQEENIRVQNLSVVSQFFSDLPEDAALSSSQGVRFRLTQEETAAVEKILASPFLQGEKKVMVCPSSAWKNKRVPFSFWKPFLEKVFEETRGSFLFVGGTEEEEAFCREIGSFFPENSLTLGRLSLPVWQNLMSRMDLLVGVDSSALHLSGTTDTPSFSFFGPTLPQVFKPMGTRHFALQGACPYGERFLKTCPQLRSCPTGACMQSFCPKAVGLAFSAWWQSLSNTIHKE